MQTLLPKLFLSVLVALCVTIYAAATGGGVLSCLAAFWVSSQVIFLYTVMWDLADALLEPVR